MPQNNLEQKLILLENRLKKIEQRGFQLKFPLDVISKKIITDIISASVSTDGFTSKAKAYRGTSVQSIATATATKVQLNAESYDVDSEFDSTTNYRFVATTAGYYQVNCAVRYAVPVADKFYIAIIRRNGSDVAYNQFHSSNTQPLTTNISDVVYLTAGQYLELFTVHSSGVAKNIDVGAEKTFLSIHRLS